MTGSDGDYDFTEDHRGVGGDLPPLQDAKEEIIYSGGPAQVLNYNTFALCGFLFAMALIAPGIYNNALAEPYPSLREPYMIVSKFLFFAPILWAFWVWLVIRCHRYVVSTEELHESSGVFSRRTDVLQLYRVKDITLDQPFTLRIFGCGNIVMDTSDKTTPIVVLKAVKSPKPLVKVLTRHVEMMRSIKGVREID